MGTRTAMVLRRAGPHFFGKTIKLNAIVTTPPQGTPSRLPRFSAPLLVAPLVGWACVTAAAPPAPTSVYSRRVARVAAAETAEQASSAERTAEDGARAERILASSLTKLTQADSFSARLRQKVESSRSR